MDAYEVTSGLFIAGWLGPADDFGALGVDAIIDLESWERAWPPPLPPANKILIRYPIEDDEGVDPKVTPIARMVADLVRDGHRVLIHCTQGLNRSALVAARALMELGDSSIEAIERVRAARGEDEEGFGALGNEAFVRWLLQQGATGG